MAGRAMQKGAASNLLTATLLLVALIAGCLIQSASAAAGGKGGIRRSREKFKEVNFFLHDNLLVPNASAYFIVPPLAGIPKQFAGHSFIGGVVVIDDLLTAGPEEDSLAIGRAKGFYVWDNNDVNAPGLEFVFTAVFNENSDFPAGSTISYRGFDLLPSPVREISISGGTSEFRLARGWAQFGVYSANEFVAVLNFTSSVFYGGY